MKRIGLLSDTHGFLDPNLFSLFDECEEIWHAGDVGKLEVFDRLQEFRTCRAVYGNIDGAEIRRAIPEWQHFTCEGMKILITHIGGYPGRYARGIKQVLLEERPDLFICGHSHILKVIFDRTHNLLHMNPGASGNQGIHKIRTALRFSIEGNRVKDTEILELGTRGRADHSF